MSDNKSTTPSTDTKPTQPTTPAKEAPPVQADKLKQALANLDKCQAFYDKPEFKAAGHNPFFALKEISELKAKLNSTKVNPTEAQIAKALAYKEVAPTLANLDLESELYRNIN